MLLVCKQELKIARCPKPPKIKFKMKSKMLFELYCYYKKESTLK